MSLFTILLSVYILVFVARKHKSSRRNIKEIWHGHVYLNKESNTSMSNTTMLRQKKKVADDEQYNLIVNKSPSIANSCVNTSLSHTKSMLKRWGGYKMRDALGGYYFRQYMKYVDKQAPDTYHGEPVETFATVSGLARYFKRRFGNNLVTDYYSKTNLSSQFKVLYDLVKRPLVNMSFPDSKLCVLHIRMGDVVDTNTLWDGTYRTQYKPWYVFPKKYYVSIVKRLKQINVTDIVITAVTYHISKGIFKQSIQKQDLYLSNIESFFKEHGFRLRRRINCGTPDEDFIFMSSADIFVQGGGKYSVYVAEMVKMNGGTVLFNKRFVKAMKTHYLFDGEYYSQNLSIISR